MLCTTFVFSDEILCNFKMTIVTSTVEWSVAIVIRALWVTVTICDEIFGNIKVSILSMHNVEE